MAVSMTGDFSDSSQENYESIKQLDVCSKIGGVIKDAYCPDGIYTVYVKFYNMYGKTSDSAIASSTIILKSPIVADIKTDLNLNSSTLANSTVPILFKQKLIPGQNNSDVKRLQIFLNSYADTLIANSGIGSPGNETTFFGHLTEKAVIKFQEKYHTEILTPLQLKRGTGIVGNATLLKINQLISNKK